MVATVYFRACTRGGSLATLRGLMIRDFRIFAWPVFALLVASGAASAADSRANVAAAALSIDSVSAPKSVIGGSAAAGSVTLNGPAPAGGVVVSLWTSGTPAFVPSSVTIAGGTTSSGIKITTVATSAAAQPVITAFYNGVRKTAALIVKPAAGLSAVSTTPGSVMGGDSATGTVTLNMAAPAGGLVIELWTCVYQAFVSKKIVFVFV